VATSFPATFLQAARPVEPALTIGIGTVEQQNPESSVSMFGSRADIFTKPLETTTFFYLRGYMPNLDNGPGMRVVLYGKAARMWSKLLAKQ